MALVFLKISEFLDTVDKLYISSVFAICRSKPRKTAKITTNMHPETHQNPTKSTLEKTMIFDIDFGMILTSKMTPKWPQNRPKWHPWAPKGPLGTPWGSHAAHQVPQDRLLAPIWHPKWPQNGQNDPNMRQNYPKMYQNDSNIVQNGILQKSKGGRRHWRSHQISAAPWPCARRVRRGRSPLKVLYVFIFFPIS